MAKRRKSTTPRAETSLVSLARTFESLSSEVTALRASLREKERQLADVQRALSAATSQMFPSAGGSPVRSRRDGRNAETPHSRRGKARGNHNGAAREGTLGDHVLKLMSDGTERGPADVLEGVKKGGYQSKGDSKSQAVMVNQTLTKLAKAGSLQKLGRGRYVEV